MTATVSMTDYFALADVFAERLREKVPGLDSVTAEEAASLSFTPVGAVAKVQFAGESVTGSGGRSAYNARQNWEVHIACRGAAMRDSETDGALIGQVIQALHGFSPTKKGAYLTYQGAVGVAEDGSRAYRLSFSIQVAADWYC